jgi:hypothetical protein
MKITPSRRPFRRVPGRATDGPLKTRKVAPKTKARSKAKAKKKKALCVQSPPLEDAFVQVFVDVWIKNLIFEERADFTDVHLWRGVCKGAMDSIDVIARSQSCHRVTYLYRQVFAFEHGHGLSAAVRPDDLPLVAYLQERGLVNLDIRPFTCCSNHHDIRRNYPWNYLPERVVPENMLVRELLRPLASVDIVGLKALSYDGCLSRYFDSEALKTLSNIITMTSSALGLRRLAVKDVLGYKNVRIQDLFAFLNSVSVLPQLEDFHLDIALAVKAQEPTRTGGNGGNLSSFKVDGFNMALHRNNIPSVHRLPEFLMETSFPKGLRVFSLGGPCSRVTEFGNWTIAVLGKVLKMLPEGLEELHLKTLGIYDRMSFEISRLLDKFPNLRKLSVTCGGFTEEQAAAFSDGLACLTKLECLSVAYQCRSPGAPFYQAMPVFTAFQRLTKLEVRIQGSVFNGNFIQAFAESLASASETLQDVSFRVSSRPSEVDDEDPTLLPGWAVEDSTTLIDAASLDSAREALYRALDLLHLRSLDWKCEDSARLHADIFILGSTVFAGLTEDDHAELTSAIAEVERHSDVDHSSNSDVTSDVSTPKKSTRRFRLEEFCIQGDRLRDLRLPYENLHTLKIRNCKGTWRRLTWSLQQLRMSLMQELEISSFDGNDGWNHGHGDGTRSQRAQRTFDVETLEDLRRLLEAVAQMENLWRLELWDLFPLAGGLYREMCQSGAQYSAQSQLLFKYVTYIRVALTFQNIAI